MANEETNLPHSEKPAFITTLLLVVGVLASSKPDLAGTWASLACVFVEPLKQVDVSKVTHAVEFETRLANQCRLSSRISNLHIFSGTYLHVVYRYYADPEEQFLKGNCTCVRPLADTVESTFSVNDWWYSDIDDGETTSSSAAALEVCPETIFQSIVRRWCFL